MIKFYVIASMENFEFAEKLLEGLKIGKVSVNTPFSKYGQNIMLQVRREIADADVIVAIIDGTFSKNSGLDYELKTARSMVQEKTNKVLIPIILDKAEIPRCVKDMSYILCDSKSDQDMYNLQRTISNYLKHSLVVPRKKREKTSSMIMLTMTMVVFTTFMVIFVVKDSGFMYYEVEKYMNFISLLLPPIIAATIVTVMTSYLSVMKRRWQEDDVEELESYSRRLKQAIIPEELIEELRDNEDSGSKKEIDALGRMMINLEDIKEFYTWSQKQAKGSFFLAVSMCVCGFVLMIVAIVLPVVYKLNIESSIVPAVGGMITEVIAGTALVVYRNSLSQLNHYHKALHEDERFLSSVNLLGKFSSDTIRDDMLKEIIRSEIQMNMLGLHEKDTKNNKEISSNDTITK